MNDLFRSKIVRYAFSGGTAAAVNLGLTLLLERGGLHYLAVVTVAFAASVVVSFSLQKFFTFRDGAKSGLHGQFAAFFGVALANLLVNDLIVYSLVGLLRFPHLVVSQAIASVAIAVYSFFLYKAIFKEH